MRRARARVVPRRARSNSSRIHSIRARPPTPRAIRLDHARLTLPEATGRAKFARVSNTDPLPLGTRLWFAWACFFRVLFDGLFAARAFEAREALPPAPEPEKPKLPEAPHRREAPEQASVTSALQLLALLQREGRFVDFLEEDVSKRSDDEIGAVARVVHDGCRKALRAPRRTRERRTARRTARGRSRPRRTRAGWRRGARTRRHHNRCALRPPLSASAGPVPAAGRGPRLPSG